MEVVTVSKSKCGKKKMITITKQAKKGKISRTVHLKLKNGAWLMAKQDRWTGCGYGKTLPAIDLTEFK